MSANSSKPSRMNQQPAPGSRAEEEAWKHRPSTETTSDEGENARIAEERRATENAPANRPPPHRPPR